MRSVISVQIMQVFGCGLTRPCRGTLVLSGDTGIFPFLLVPLTDSVSISMKLIQVMYELYSSDIVWLKEYKNDNLHAINREIRLCFEDRPCIWLSWGSELREFCVSYSLTPHLSGQIDMISDMTHSFIWQRFIGIRNHFDLS